MLKKDVVIGAVYVAKISGKLTEVRILEAFDTHAFGGRSERTRWTAKNLSTGREVTIKSAAKLRLRTTSKLDSSKTQSQLLAEKNQRANQKHQADLKSGAELHQRIAAGNITAGEALKQLASGVKATEIGVTPDQVSMTAEGMFQAKR